MTDVSNIINKDSVVDDILPNFTSIIEGRMLDGFQRTYGENRNIRDRWLGTLLRFTNCPLFHKSLPTNFDLKIYLAYFAFFIRGETTCT